jgi:ribose-phosphate pyrophosphokinase|tara:strand:- start:1328 stop:2230 length:903 start_codon:yes stop_codon:yes gene_type:complete
MMQTKYALNLDPKFNPTEWYELEHKQLDFKGGEPHIQITQRVVDIEVVLVITQRYNNVRDLIMVVLANDAARRMGFTKIELVMPYFPAARQDRVCNEGEPLTIKVFADMINGCAFDKVSIYTPHSEVTPALLDNCRQLDLDNEFVEDIIFDDVFDGSVNWNIACPDAGAGKRVASIVKHLANNIPKKNFNLIRCEKVRDVKDGSLKEFHVQADDLNGYPTLIVDDINSMGGTFLGLGSVLRSKNCGDLALFTSHSDCRPGIEKVCGFFDKVYTTNSRQDWDTYNFPDIHKFKCFNIYMTV